MSVILVFDDDPIEREQLTDRLEDICGGETEILPFESNDALADGASFERHIALWIDKHCAGKDVALIVCDKELGRYDKLKGLSATPVSAVAQLKGLPFCQYSRQPGLNDREIARFERLQQWSSEEITLEGLDTEAWAPQAAAIFRGFEQIKAKYKDLGDTPGTPALALASILDHPESESRIALYGSGEQGFLKEIFTFYDPKEGKPDMDLLCKRMPRILGNWLYLSILRFPGILVNQVAAASYLNIDCEKFRQGEVQQHFEATKYTGPFYELGPWWWRAELDVLLGAAQSEDGREYVEKKDILVNECLDPQSNGRAGYYCMLTQEPVSADNSRGGISWFPSGADLARIQKDKFEEITALVGMY